MTAEEIRIFISKIISSGYEENIKCSLAELINILTYDQVDEELIKPVRELLDTAKEAAELGIKKQGGIVTEEELSTAIRDGRARIEREAWRC